MNKNKKMILIQKINAYGGLRDKTYPNDGGYDMFVAETTDLPPKELTFVPAGFKMKLPQGTSALVIGRSSAAKEGLLVVTGLIDEGYTGLMFTLVYNMTDSMKTVKVGDRISQIIVLSNTSERMSLHYVFNLPETKRGEKGFGSSGGGI